MSRPPSRLILAITGATGMVYVRELLILLAEMEVEVHAVISAAGRQVLALELERRPEELPHVLRWFGEDDFTAPPASGSCRYDGMVILPCTMGTLGALATGYCGNLIHRAADVTLKEQRPLVLAIRETPLNRTHLVNMLALHDAGATICPAMPSFYTRPGSLTAMARGFAGRLLDQLGLHHDAVDRWQDH